MDLVALVQLMGDSSARACPRATPSAAEIDRRLAIQIKVDERRTMKLHRCSLCL